MVKMTGGNPKMQASHARRILEEEKRGGTVPAEHASAARRAAAEHYAREADAARHEH